MSNFNALLNAIVVATNSNHAVPATTAAASAPGANAAAVKGHAAAASGAATHGAANVTGTNVSAPAGAGNSAQPAAPPGLRVPRGVPLRCTDSTTDLVEKKDNGQFYSLRMGNTVNSPFTQHFPPPSPFAGPSRSYRAGRRASTYGSLARKGAALRRTDSATNSAKKTGNGQSGSPRKPGVINDAVIQQFPPPPPFDQPTFPSVSVASTRPPPPVFLPDILPLQPIVIPIDLFAPAPVTQFMVETGPSTAFPPSSRPAIAVVPVYPGAEGLDRPYYDAINARAAKARSDLAWPGAGLRERQPHAHHTTPEDCQALRRWMLYRGRKDSNLILAEALCVENKNQQLIMLEQLREADLLEPPHLRENFVTGAQVSAQFQIARVHALLQLSAAQAAFVASVFFPEAPPVPAPQPSLPPPPPRPPRSIWFAVASAMAGMLKRKRGADDDSEEHPAKRARVQKEPEPQRRFVFLRRVGTKQPPPTLGGAIVETCPEPLPEHGAAAYPDSFHTSNVTTRTDMHPVFPALASSLARAGVAGPSRQPSTAPLARTSSLVDAGASLSAAPLVESPTGEQRCVRFSGCPGSESIAPPRRYSSPPPPPRNWTQDEDEDEDEDGDMLTDAMLTVADLAALGLDFSTARPTDRHPAAGDDAADNDSPMQDDSLPSPDAATGQKRRRETRAGRQVQRRRASKEAATATERNLKVEGA